MPTTVRSAVFRGGSRGVAEPVPAPLTEAAPSGGDPTLGGPAHEDPPSRRHPPRPRVRRRRGSPRRGPPPGGPARRALAGARGRTGRRVSAQSSSPATSTSTPRSPPTPSRSWRGSSSAPRCPVLVTPGNHDPYVAGSAWQLAAWPANVHMFAADRVEPFELGDDVVVWGAAFCAATAPAGIPDGFRRPSDGRTHLLALHAALTGERWADEGRHRSVTRAQLGRPTSRASSSDISTTATTTACSATRAAPSRSDGASATAITAPRSSRSRRPESPRGTCRSRPAGTSSGPCRWRARPAQPTSRPGRSRGRPASRAPACG